MNLGGRVTFRGTRNKLDLNVHTHTSGSYFFLPQHGSKAGTDTEPEGEVASRGRENEKIC